MVGLLLLAGPGAAVAVEERWEFDARMRGAGRAVGGVAVAYAFDLPCEPEHRVSHLVVRWGGRHRFRLGRVTDAVCESRSGTAAAASNFDTHRGEGEGSLDGTDGARVAWTLTQGHVELTVTDATGQPVLDLSGPAEGRHRASGQALLPVAPGVDADGVVNRLVIDGLGRPRLFTRTPLDAGAFTEEPADPAPKPDAVVPVPPPVIHPALESMLAERDPDERVVVVVNLRDDISISRLPDLPRGVRRESEEAAPVRAAQQAIIEDLREARRRSIDAFLARLGPGPDLRVLERFWLTNAFVADARLGDVRALAASPDVLHVQPNLLETPATAPSHDGSPDFPPHADVAAARALIGTDAYFNLPGMTQGYVGLLDTGFALHLLLVKLGTLEGDCVDGGFDCRQTLNAGYDTFDCHDHGTSTAAILNGNYLLGQGVRGVTDIIVDRWKVWINGPPHCSTVDGITATAVQRAFEVGLSEGDRVFAAVIQPAEPVTGTIATAADNAFDAGAIVVAANGNCAVSSDCTKRMGPPAPAFGTVRSPALAHKVIGVGDFNVVDLATRQYQGRGPTSDGRVKPDIQAPTDVRTASRTSTTALKERFGGTSAATPFAAGAAALLRNWLRKYQTFDPGYTYARLILSGNFSWSFFGYSQLFGAGQLRLPAPCRLHAHWGKLTFRGSQRKGQTSVAEIPITVTSAVNDGLAVALWWPESAGEAHDDIDVSVVDPNGVVQAQALSEPSVFERTEVAGPVMTGTWTVRIRAVDLQSPPQTVFWTADVRGPCLRLRGRGRRRD
jgi:hypothetical protein